MKLPIALSLLAALLLGLLVPPQDGYKAVPLGGSVYFLEGGRGGNLAVSAGDDGILLVDDQFEDLGPQIQQALGELPGQKLKFLVNTHWHGDHTGSNAHLGREAPILAQRNVRGRMSASQTNRFGTRPPSPPEALPVITYDDNVSIHFNGEEVRLLHLTEKAHTDGDSIVWFTGSNVIHMGDLFFNGSFPFVDLGTGGNVKGLLRAVEQALALAPRDATLVPGHGPVGTWEDLDAYRKMIAETMRIVQAKAGRGLGVEQVKREGLPARFNSWDGGFIKGPDWVEIIYRSQFPEGR